MRDSGDACCYTGTGRGEPAALRQSLGVAMATDIGRTYRLQREGYTVEWDAIPSSITAMNRLIIAHPHNRRPPPG